MLGILIFKSD